MDMHPKGLRGALAGMGLLLVFGTGCGQSGDSSSAELETPSTAAPASVQPVPDGHSSRISLDWPGTYSGVLPCASCPGIETEVTVNADGSYRLSRFYLDEGGAPDVQTGTFRWDDSGANVTLDEAGGGQQYQVGENVLFHLDRAGQRITGDLAGRYVLERHVNDPDIEDRIWRLIELRGQPVDGGQPDSSPVLNLKSAGAVASGNASCNTFSGTYALKHGNRIRFGRQMAVTRMACPDMTLEAGFLEMMTMVDNYAVGPEGRLSLNRARMAPLARFDPVDEG